MIFSTADTATPTISGWSSSLFRDTNCNGILDGTEGGTILTGSVAVAAADPICSIVVSDFTPSFTIFVSAQCATPLPSSLTAGSVTTQPTVGGQGNLNWTLAGSLQSGASGSVLFRVTLQ